MPVLSLKLLSLRRSFRNCLEIGLLLRKCRSNESVALCHLPLELIYVDQSTARELPVNKYTKALGVERN